MQSDVKSHSFLILFVRDIKAFLHTDLNAILPPDEIRQKKSLPEGRL